MNTKKLKKIRAELESILRSPYGRTAREFESLAAQLGRTLDARGKEPTYVRSAAPSLSPPLSIPSHAKEFGAGLAKSLANALLSDVDDWEIFLLEVDDE